MQKFTIETYFTRIPISGCCSPL